MNENAQIQSLTEDAKIKEYSSKLEGLRKEGVTKIAELKQEIFALKKNKLIGEGEKQKQIEAKKA